MQGSRGTTGCWRSVWLPASGDVPAGSLCHKQSSGGYRNPLLPQLIPARLRPTGEHDLCPTTSSQNTGQGTKSPEITVRSPASNDWRSPTPKRVCQQLFSQDPAPGPARTSKGIAKLKRSVPEPFADLSNRLRCFVGYQSIHDHCSLVITGFPGACSKFFCPH